MCYGIPLAGFGSTGLCSASIGRGVLRIIFAAIAALTCILALGACASPGGFQSRESGSITNTFNINTGVPQQQMMVPAKRKGESPTVTPTATADSASSVSSTGQGNVTIHFEQGTSKAQIPVSTGVAASMPAGGTSPLGAQKQ